MKTINKFILATLVALAAMLLFSTSSTRAEDFSGWGVSNNRGREPTDAKVTFTKWLIGSGPNMEGVVGGDVGNGMYTGEILLFQAISRGGVQVQTVEAMYHFHGSKHSFTALVHVEQPNSNPGTKSVIIGVVTDGWLKGHALKGGYTVKSFVHNGVPSLYFEGTLEINREAID